jgi:quercetin dioxygenase-like cupin family protein
MEYGRATIEDDVSSAEMGTSRQPVYDRDFELKLLHQDPRSRAEHYVVRYPPGLRALPHRHSAAHTIVVLKGRLAVNDTVVGPGGYCYFPAGEVMFHSPADEEECVFVIFFDGPLDVQVVADELRTS